jgi:transcription antitermination factor NusG
MKSWYVLRVKARHERLAGEELEIKGYEQLVPTYTERRKWSDRVQSIRVPLFPGYVFCRLGYEQRLHVLRTEGVKSILSFGNVPAVVADDEIAAVRSIAESGLPAHPWPYLHSGDYVVVRHGPLAGVSGVLVCEKTLCRVVVNVEILQRAVSVELDRAMLSACGGAARSFARS